MEKTVVAQRTVLRIGALASTALAMPYVRGARAAGGVVPSGKLVLAWHTNIATRWLDPQQHDGRFRAVRPPAPIPEPSIALGTDGLHDLYGSFSVKWFFVL